MSKDAKYNGWANYQTWNVILWMDNDAKLHAIARKATSYSAFRAAIKEFYSVGSYRGDICYYPLAFETPDNVAWNDSAICMAEVDNWFLGRGVRSNYKAKKQAEGE